MHIGCVLLNALAALRCWCQWIWCRLLLCVSADEVNSSSRTEPDTWDEEDLDHKCSSWCREDSLDSVSIRGKLTKDEEDEESDGEPWFRVGDSCYKGVSSALNTHRSPRNDVNHSSAEERSPCANSSGASQESQSLGTENTRLRRDESVPTRAQKKKKERKFSVKKTKTSKLSLKNRTSRSSLQRAARNIKKKRHKRGEE